LTWNDNNIRRIYRLNDVLKLTSLFTLINVIEEGHVYKYVK